MATPPMSAVVTGAARGFGKEIARRLVARGHRVLITDLDADAVGATAEELGGPRVVMGIVADGGSADDHRMAAAAAAELGAVGVWVNNAGVLRAAVLAFTTSLAGDLALAGLPIRAHALCPDAADTALVRDEQAHEDTALLFSRPTLLAPATVADAAMALLEGRRIVRSLPAGRAGLARVGGLLPSVGLPVLARLRAQGDRRRRASP